MQMERRRFLVLGARCGAGVLISGAIIPLTGCDIQSEIIALLNEMQTDWQSFATAAGQSVNPIIKNAFSAAVTAVTNWKPGTAAQDVVEALQVLDSDILPLIPVVTPLEQALAQVVLGSIINLIELIDPNANPVSAVSMGVATQAHDSHIIENARVGAIGGSVKGEKVTRSAVGKIRSDFGRRWKLVKTGKLATSVVSKLRSSDLAEHAYPWMLNGSDGFVYFI